MSKRAALTVVREPGKSAKESPDKIVLPPSEPIEPNWMELFPIRGLTGEELKDMKRVRAVAHEVWHRWVDTLKKAGVVRAIHTEVLGDAAIVVARIDQCERDISVNGIVYRSNNGQRVMNRSVTAAGLYRRQLSGYVRQLGLAPNVDLKHRSSHDDDDDVWDP